jgi:hypothetical protein
MNNDGTVALSAFVDQPTTVTNAIGTVASAGASGLATSSGLVILAHFDSSITNLATSSPTLYGEITNAITAAAQFYEAEISNSITISINFGYGEVGGTPLSGGALGESQTNYDAVSYSTLRTALISHATSTDDLTAISNVPASDPTGRGTWDVADSEAEALGLLNTSGTLMTGDVGISSSASFTYDPGNRAVSGDYDVIGVLEHEISEVMGRVGSLGAYLGNNVYTPLDLFRYSANGTRDLSPGAGYFSIDAGRTNLDAFNNPRTGGDAADWSTSVVDDSYDAFSTIGVANTVSATDLRLMDVLGYTLATPAACYAAGTRILTAQGEVCVEDLAVGDTLCTHFAGLAAIIWIGSRRIDCCRHPEPHTVWPVRISAGAFAPGRPHRDLLLSPDHAVFIDNVLIPVKCLINGSTIAQVPSAIVTYYHVELQQHDILLAENLPAESFLDTGNRGNFVNHSGPVWLHPDFAGLAWDGYGCAPLIVAGTELEAVRAELAAIADRVSPKKQLAEGNVHDPRRITPAR